MGLFRNGLLDARLPDAGQRGLGPIENRSSVSLGSFPKLFRDARRALPGKQPGMSCVDFRRGVSRPTTLGRQI